MSQELSGALKRLQTEQGAVLLGTSEFPTLWVGIRAFSKAWRSVGGFFLLLPSSGSGWLAVAKTPDTVVAGQGDGGGISDCPLPQARRAVKVIRNLITQG
jgi:hypothetical protein